MTLHYLLMAGHAQMRRCVQRALRETGLTPGQPKVLDYLGLQDGASQREIAEACHIEPATLSSLLRRMEEGGLVERRGLGGDRRTAHVYLTDRGRGMQRQVEEAFRRLDLAALGGVPPEDRETALRVLKAVLENLQKEQT